MKKVFSVLVMLMFVCCLAACGGSKEGETIKLGSSGPLSGSASIYGTAVKKGIELAIEEINNAGGVDVNGTKKNFELVDFINDEAEAAKAGSALTTLVAKDVDVVIGAVTSGATEGLINEAIKYGVRKVNVDTDLRMAMTGAIRKVYTEKPAEFDPRKYLKPAMDAMQAVCEARYQEFGAAGQAGHIKPISLADMAKRYKSGELDPKINR